MNGCLSANAKPFIPSQRDDTSFTEVVSKKTKDLQKKLRVTGKSEMELQKECRVLRHKNASLEKKLKIQRYHHELDRESLTDIQKTLDKERRSSESKRELLEKKLRRAELDYRKTSASLLEEVRRTIDTRKSNVRLTEEKNIQTERIRKLEIQRHTLESGYDEWKRIAKDWKEKSINAEDVNEGWIGRTLKLKWIIDEMDKVGAIRLPDHEWATDMVGDIEIPEVSMSIRRKFLPSFEDSHMEFDGGEREQEEIYAELSRAAAEHSLLLGDNPEETIATVIKIQKMFRGFSTRKSLARLHGDNPRERISAATMIQKIFRGFRTRVVFFYDSPPDQETILKSWSLGGQSRTSIVFVNSGDEEIELRWMKTDSVLADPTSIRPRSAGLIHPISTFTGHWFSVCVLRLDSEPSPRYITIPKRFVRGTYFDLSTGITLTRSQWNIYSARMKNEEGNHQTRDRSDIRCRCSGCRRTQSMRMPSAGSSGFQESDYDAQIRIAIQMSLEENSLPREELQAIRSQRRRDRRHERNQEVDYGVDMGTMFNEQEQEQEQPTGPGLTDDVPDYSIGFSGMFQ